MHTKQSRSWFYCGLLALACGGLGATGSSNAGTSPDMRGAVFKPGQPALAKLDAATQVHLQASYGKLPMAFEANQGQSDAAVRYLARGPGYNLFLTETEAVLSLDRGETNKRGPQKPAAESSVLHLKFMGAKALPRMTGEDELPGKINYFRGKDPAQWRTGVPTYARIRSRDVYPGVDLVYYGNQSQLEYDLVLAPGADPNVIRIAFEGADGLHVDAAGNLVVKLGGQKLVQHTPLVYQLSNGKTVKVPARYVLADNGLVSVSVGEYERGRALVIDPVLAYSTYLGGSGHDFCYAIAVDGAGNAYVTGHTQSDDFPTVNPLQSKPASTYDVYVTKINPQGSALVYSTYLGGSGDDYPAAIAADRAGYAYVTGDTRSLDFPVKNALQPDHVGAAGYGSDAFVVKLDPRGSALVYSTYLGGTEDEAGQGIAADGDGNAYLTGFTSSLDFPIANALQPVFHGQAFYDEDAFVAKISANGSALMYSTYLGGTRGDIGTGIAVDTTGAAYVTGFTGSSDFPTAHAMQPAIGGTQFIEDAFVSKLDATGTSLDYSTFLGGSYPDRGYGIAVDGEGNAYVAGITDSDDFPTRNAVQPVLNGPSDAYIAKLNTAGSALVYSTYFGGSSEDGAWGPMGLDSEDNVYVAGTTGSDDFPTRNAVQPLFGGYADAFVLKLNFAGSALIYSTYLGGNGEDVGIGVGVDDAGNAYTAGSTRFSPDFPIVNAVQPAPGGGNAAGSDAFVAKISEGVAMIPRLRTDRDIDGDGAPDLAVLTADGKKVSVKRQTGQLIGNVAFNKAGTPVAFETMDNFGGTPAPEFAVLGAGGVSEVRDARSGELLGSVIFDPKLTPVDLAVLKDVNGNGVPELAMLGQSSAGQGIVEIRDAATGTRLTRITYASVLQPKGLVTIDDLNGDGRRELGMLGDHVTLKGNDRIEVRDGFTGLRIVNLWLGSRFTVELSRRVGDLTGDGIGEVATLRTKPNAVNVLVEDPVNATTVTGMGFTPQYRPVDLVSIDDFNHNGAFELGLLARDSVTGSQRMDILDSRSKQRLRRLTFPKDFVVQGADVLPDRNGNGAEEVAVLARRNSDGAMNVYIKDAASGALLQRVPF